MVVVELLLILATLAAAPNDPSLAAGGDLFACDFVNQTAGAGQKPTPCDRDYDGWPDDWTRQHSSSLPEFVRVALVAAGQTISAADSAPGKAHDNRVLRIELDGAGAAITSPRIPCGPQLSLLLSLRIKTSGLTRDGAWAELALLDKEGRPLESLASTPVRGSSDWTTVQIGPLTPSSDQAAQAVISLHLGPLDDSEDLTGSAEFDDVRLVRLPRMTLLSNSSTGICTDPAKLELACEVSGIRALQPQVRFELRDHEGQLLAQHSTPLVATSDVDAASRPVSAGVEGYVGRAEWKPPLPGYGIFRVTTTLFTPSQSEDVLTRSQNLAVLRPLGAPAHSAFGWSLPAGEKPFSYAKLAAIVSQAGVGRVKLPVWYDPHDSARAERIAWFAEQLSIQNIELVGVLDQPPEELRQVFREPGRLPIASVLAEPALWQPAVAPVMTRLSLRVRWWQLGDDQDTSFVGYPLLESRLAEIKRHMEEYGQEVRLGVGWRWLHEPPLNTSGNKALAFLSYDAEPALTAAELTQYLPLPPPPIAAATESTSRRGAAAAAKPPAPLQRWIVLTPLPRGEYSRRTRVQDLVQRMVAARICAADGIFVPEPFHPERGLMSEDGSPGELFVPWRTTALLVGGAEFLGQIQLPGGSTCYAFGREGNAVLVLWSPSPTTERLYLGDNVEQIDAYGRSLAPKSSDDQGRTVHEIAVDSLPTFVTGVSSAVARWQAALKFDNERLASVYKVKQTITLRVPNPFPQSIGGEVTLHAPPTWSVDPWPIRFKAGVGEELQVSLPVTLEQDTNSGPQPVRLDFDITGDRSHHFSVERTLQLGLEDVQIELRTRLRDDGALVVEQQLMNLSDKPVSFQCLLFPPGRRREVRQIVGAEPGRSAMTYILPRGEELIGQKLRLRAEEISGPRVLIHSMTIER